MFSKDTRAGGSDERKTPNPPSRGEALRRSSLFNRAANAILKGSVKEMLNVVSYVTLLGKNTPPNLEGQS